MQIPRTHLHSVLFGCWSRRPSGRVKMLTRKTPLCDSNVVFSNRKTQFPHMQSGPCVYAQERGVIGYVRALYCVTQHQANAAHFNSATLMIIMSTCETPHETAKNRAQVCVLGATWGQYTFKLCTQGSSFIAIICNEQQCAYTWLDAQWHFWFNMLLRGVICNLTFWLVL
jgi:hypothetical protein